jgi:5,10-methylenetetrahydrofolate reductase
MAVPSLQRPERMRYRYPGIRASSTSSLTLSLGGRYHVVFRKQPSIISQEEINFVKSGSKLERVLASGQFAVTAEAGPPRGAQPDPMLKKGNLLKDACDAINVTDNQIAMVRMSSMAGCVLLKQTGAEPILQLAMRDRNRLALQSDVLGAAALGIRNVLCIAGDHQHLGNHPSALGVYDIDPIHLITAIKALRDEHKLMNGQGITGEVPLYIGAVANPTVEATGMGLLGLRKKIAAGADFIQTQAVFDVAGFRAWMEQVRAQGLHERVHILPSILPIKSLDMARRMRAGIPGLRMPEELVLRMEKASDAGEIGVQFSVELIEQLRATPGVHGVHIMAVAWENIVPRIVKEAGLSPRPA